MVLKAYLYGMAIVGGAVFASNLYFADRKEKDEVVLRTAAQRAIRYGAPWPMTLLELHSKYTKGEDYLEIFKPR